jgi:hypothetical protein
LLAEVGDALSTHAHRLYAADSSEATLD